MMEGVFFTVLSMSAAAAVTAVAVMLLRLPLKRAPRWVSCALWAVVLFRMVCPVSFSSPLSLMPQAVSRPAFSAQHLPAAETTPQSAPVSTQTTSAAQTQPSAVQPSPPEGTAFAKTGPTWQSVVPWVWLAGVAVMLAYALVSYLILKRKLTDGVKVEEGVYETDAIDSPFVCGVFSPRIYLPVGLPEKERRYVLLHERAHLRRRDHILKPLAFLALAVHWFNPVLWVSFALYSRDVESACDQAVIQSFPRNETAGYSAALLHLGRKKVLPAAGPLAFGEENAKGRVQGVLRYKKPAFWVSLAAVAACIVAAVVLLGNPASSLKPTQGDAAPAQLEAASAQAGDASSLSAADFIPGAASPALQGKQTMKLQLTGRVKAMALYAEQWQGGMLLTQDCIAYTDVNGNRDETLTLEQTLTDKGLVWWQLSQNQNRAPLSGIVTLPCQQGASLVQWVGIPHRQTLRAGGSYFLSAAVSDPDGGTWTPKVLAQNPDTIRTAPAAFVLRLELFQNPAGETPPASAHDTSLADTLYALKNPYIGDASADGAILQALHIRDRVGPYTIELQTDQPPYGITLSFSDQLEGLDDQAFSAKESYLRGCADLFLALVDNADTVSWKFHTLDSSASGTSDNQTETPEAMHPKDYGATPEQFRELVREESGELSRVAGMRLSGLYCVPSRILYLANPPQNMSPADLLSLYGHSLFVFDPGGFSARWSSDLSSALPETDRFSRPDYRPAAVDGLDFPGSEGLHLADYSKKTAYQVYTSDGQDTGYRLFFLDNDLYVAHWKEGTLAYFIQLAPPSPPIPPFSADS